ncbi:uncharacterized protein LOC129905998 [Episyrphus balteatus]|uniref:uncharacterized protein LOC129905998 n=1 Tax=Episyrphus balteatus TaxID=286459 RepID=UPI002485DCFD|nr:uncharacterized protein LOC129905998 [Episyrphus balteatus]
MESASNAAQKQKFHICGVNQCHQYRSPGISMHRIPKKVLSNRNELLKWKQILKMGKPFPKNFVICSSHFKEGQILKSLPRGKRSHSYLVDTAFPSLNLPKSIIITKIENNKQDRLERLKKRHDEFSRQNSLNVERSKVQEVSLSKDTSETVIINQNNEINEFNTIGIQCEVEVADKGTQVSEKEDLHFYSLPFALDTDEKLNTMTGIPTLDFLEKLVQFCLLVRPSVGEKKRGMCVKNKIILCMYRLKNNSTNAHISILFNLSSKTAKTYFTSYIQLLSKALKPFIYWPTTEENQKSMPKCFEKFSNVVTVLDCTEIRTVQFRCLTCKCCTYSHYKGTHTVKVMVGITPSGLVNFISPSVSGRTSDKAVFNLTGLIKVLKPGDAVMVDKGFMIGNELFQAGIEMIRPQFMNPERTRDDVEKDRLIASARVHVERRFARIKQFKMLSEKVTESMLPYFDDIVTVVCAISNLSSPILSDEKF